MKKKIIVCIILLLIVIVGAIVLLSNGSSDQEKGKDMSDFDKPVTEYTWEDFNALKASEQMEFQNSFEDIEEFDKWLQKAQGNGEEEIPWEEGGKQPEEYTWDEFNDLSMNQQMEFQRSFEDLDEFDKWLQKAQKDAE